MMKTILGGALAIAVFATASLFLLPKQDAKASAFTATTIGAATTTTSFSVTSSTRVLATTTATVGTSYTRVYATICNPNANPVALFLNNDAKANTPAGDATTFIAAAAGYSACYEITDRNEYQGSIQASSTGQTATTVFVSDYVQ